MNLTRVRIISIRLRAWLVTMRLLVSPLVAHLLMLGLVVEDLSNIV